MTQRIFCGYYSVHVNGDEERAVVSRAAIATIAERLPHGSGIDGDWAIDILGNGNLIISSSYHAMDDDGFYDGWADFSVRVYKAKMDETHELRGPCAGQIQITARKGDIMVSAVRGARRNGINMAIVREYLDDVLDDVFDGIETRRNEIVVA